MELSEIREKIDAVDDQLLDLFLERMHLSEEVAAYKNEHHLPILNKERERAILAKVTEKSGDKERYAYHLFSTLFELARSRQAELIDAPTKVGAQIKAALADMNEVFPQTGLVACQGVEGANSQVACDRLLPRGNIVYVKTFQAVVSAVESGLCKFGVLPIENSSNGSVRAVYELLQDHNLTIVRSTRLCIRHELLALPGVKMGDITEIYSHEQAIGQCSKFLNGLNGVRVIPCDNTAAAAKMVAERGDRHAAAISSHPCAALYGLDAVSDEIQDSDNNYTRFICVTKDPVIYAGANRISLIIACDNKPGALYEILSKLAALGINMTKLESCPVTGRNFEFIFFLELEASVQEPGVLAMLEELERSCAGFHFLGNYAESLTHGRTRLRPAGPEAGPQLVRAHPRRPGLRRLPPYRAGAGGPGPLPPPGRHRRAERHHPLQAGRDAPVRCHRPGGGGHRHRQHHRPAAGREADGLQHGHRRLPLHGPAGGHLPGREEGRHPGQRRGVPDGPGRRPAGGGARRSRSSPAPARTTMKISPATRTRRSW